MKKILKIYVITTALLLFACTRHSKIYYDANNNKVYDLSYFKNSEIIIPKNQSLAQSLSIIVKNENDDLIIFDGGREEDAEYLYSIIEEHGGKVEAWFLTHIHDDHIGALYNILVKHPNDIDIKNIYFSFADFDWYFKMIANDAGVLMLFYDALKQYGRANIHNDIARDDIYKIGNVDVRVLNNIFLLDSDPINNTSIAYKTTIDDKSIIILGDLGYKGGENLYHSLDDKTILNSDILVLSHHGQNGVPMEFYYYVRPTVVVWPTTKSIYENINGKYDTDTTKQCITDLNVKYQIFSYLETSIIK